jgi:gamma-glutamyl:cysteine ligase YbdK (ATP-grasp superfamily)
VGSKEEAITVMDVARDFLPAILAMSARSPRKFRKRGLYRMDDLIAQSGGRSSYRFIKYRHMAGDVAPPLLESWERFTEVAHEKGFYDDPRMCWWGLRISPHGSVELRVSDLQENRIATLAIAAVFRAIARLAITGKWSALRSSREDIEAALQRAADDSFDHRPLLDSIMQLAWQNVYDDECAAYQFNARFNSSGAL